MTFRCRCKWTTTINEIDSISIVQWSLLRPSVRYVQRLYSFHTVSTRQPVLSRELLDLSFRIEPQWRLEGLLVAPC